jgi:hypothetical protein
VGPGDTESAVALAEIAGKFDIMMQSIASVKDKQDEMAENIAQIREAVYHPYQGLYARIRELESWKETQSRVVWIMLTAIVGLSVATVYKSIFS